MRTIMGMVERAIDSRVLMIIVEEEGSGEQVGLGCFGTAIHAVTFLFDSSPASSSIGELSAAIHDIV